MTGNKSDIISILYRLMLKEKIVEIEWKNQKEKILIKRFTPQLQSLSTTNLPLLKKEIQEEPIDQDLIVVKSPFAGIFYRSPSPDSEPFIKENEETHLGETLCIVEAMKVMNEIKSNVKGKIKKILVADGDSVAVDQPLFLILPER